MICFFWANQPVFRTDWLNFDENTLAPDDPVLSEKNKVHAIHKVSGIVIFIIETSGVIGQFGITRYGFDKDMKPYILIGYA